MAMHGERTPPVHLPAPASGGRVRSARAGTAVVFAVHGAVMGTFAARIPWVAAHVGLDVAGLGVALLMPGLGALCAMPASGRLIHRHRLHRLTGTLMLLWCAALVLPALPTGLPVLCVALVVFGGASGLADVTMNAHAVLVEELHGRSLMSGMHGMWSVGVLAGSGVAALAAHAGWDARVHFAAVAAVLAVVVVGACGLLIPHRPDQDQGAPAAFALPSREVLPIGLVGLCAVFGEGAGQDWSATFVREHLEGDPGTAALTVSVFAFSMAAARFAGDRVVERLGAVRTVRIAAGCGVAGALLVLAAPTVPVAVAGFALLGVGVSVVVPLAFAAAGRVGPHPGRSLAGVAGIAYGAGLLTPGIIGGIARVSSLAVSFGAVALLCLVMGVTAGVLRPGPR